MSADCLAKSTKNAGGGTGATLVVDGFTQHLESGGNPWVLAEALSPYFLTSPRECVQNHDANSVIAGELGGRAVLAGYSFGGSSLYLLSNEGQTLACDVLLLVLSVPDLARGQAGNWRRPFSVRRCYAFQLGPDQAFPVSEPIAGAPWADITDPHLWDIILGTETLNISCKALAKKIPWWEWLFGGLSTKIWNHCNVMNHPSVIDLCVRIAREFAGGTAETSCQTE